MSGYFFGFGLARPIFFAALLALIPIFLWQRRRLTHFPAVIQTLLLGLRCSVVVLLVGALIGPQRVEENFRKFVVFCVDQSGSLPEAGFQPSAAFIEEALKNRGDNEYAVLPFAGKPGAIGRTVIKPTDGDSSPLKLLNPSQTDFAKASVLAEAAAPEDYVGEVVLLSDFKAARNANARTINQFKVEAHRVDTGAQEEQPEICVDQVVVPAAVKTGQPITVEVRVKSNVAQSAQVSLSSDSGSKFAPVPFSFTKPGIQAVYFDAAAPKSGTVQFTAVVSSVTKPGTDAAGASDSAAAAPDSATAGSSIALPKPEKDTLLENNRYSASTVVWPQGKILLVENRKNLAEALSKALSEQYLTLVSCTGDQIPVDLSAFEAIILSNIPATAIDEPTMALLEEYVQRGGGLIAAGGDQSFTAGGWHGTTLEKLMPVECIVQPNQPRPALAMVLVIDRSQSMIENSQDSAKTAMELSKQAARRAVDVLTDQDLLGVLTFEDNFNWNVPLAPCSDKQAILDKIDSIQAAGRTNLYPALEKAYSALSESFAERKHIIVLTDGISQPGDFEALSKKIAATGISLSTVAVGEEGDCPVLSDLARNCKGKRYLCKDPEQLPAIFAMETAAAAKMGIIEKTTKLQSVGSLSALGRFDAAQSPSLLGYVQTKIKPDSFSLYNAPKITDSEGVSIADPILAWRRYGSQGGIVIAFTSDVESRWSRAWQRWAGFGPFWSRLINHAKRPNPADAYSVVLVDGKIKVSGPISEFCDASSKPVFCRLLKVADKEKELAKNSWTDIPETAPGVFTVDAPQPGLYSIQIVRGSDDALWQSPLTVVENYTDEYRLDKSDSLPSDRIPSVIAAANVFDKSETAVLKTYRYWSWLLALGLCLTAAEVFIRRTGVA